MPTAVLLPSGPNNIKAYYGGDGTYAPASSPVLPQSVNAVAANTFSPLANYALPNPRLRVGIGDFGIFQPPMSNSGGGEVTGCDFAADFNGDGKLDIAAGASNGSSNGLEVFLGNGDGTSSSRCSTPERRPPIAKPPR